MADFEATSDIAFTGSNVPLWPSAGKRPTRDAALPFADSQPSRWRGRRQTRFRNANCAAVSLIFRRGRELVSVPCESTSIRLDPVEAYADAHRRTMQFSGTAISFSLQVANAQGNDTALRALKEGDVVGPRDLEALVPGVNAVAWEFVAGTEYNVLQTITDGVLVTLKCHRASDLTPFTAEGVLRGFAARIIVEMTGF